MGWLSVGTERWNTRQLAPLITRTEAKLQPVRAEFRQKSPHLESETVESACWEATTLHQDEIDYIGEELTDILGRHYTLQD
jgi:hypothetical protein